MCWVRLKIKENLIIIWKLHLMRYHSINKRQIYEEVIETLNSLQTNAQVLQRLKITKALKQENNIETTTKYLQRSGVTLDQIESNLSVIHVSGTKGKGSTCAMCESVLHSLGYKTGFYSSPHLVEVRERIRINKVPLRESEFTNYFWSVYNKLNEAKDNQSDMPSYFKFLTIMALNVFLAENVDVAIIEVGIGGEYDCTNIFSKPAVVGISSLGLDHTSLLGNTIEQIAWQKGGIMKPKTPAFTSPQPTCALKILHERAIEKQCSLWEVPSLLNYDWQGLEVAVGLRGDVQMINASLALQLSEAWINRKRLDTYSIGFLGYAKILKINKSIAEGLKQCSWPGRYQILTRKFIYGKCTYYIDGAHTKESIQLCTQWFKETITNVLSRNVCKYSLLFNVTGDRESSDLLAVLMSCNFDNAYFCPNILASDSKSSDLMNYMSTPKEQLDRCEEIRKNWLCLERQRSAFCTEVKTFLSVTEALKHIESQEGEQHVLVTGSLHLIGAVLTILDPRPNTFSNL